MKMREGESMVLDDKSEGIGSVEPTMIRIDRVSKSRQVVSSKES